MSGPRILITNDDGVDAPGLEIMRAIAADLSDDVWVVAPAKNMSGAGHQLSFGRELTMEQRDAHTFAVAGSPADCVVVGCTHILKDHKPDIVLSGVNNGQNLGDLVHCSGTVAGAREGVLQGALGIAISQAVDYESRAEVDWAPAKRHGAGLVRHLMDATTGADVVYNINFPVTESEELPPVKIVPHQRFSISPFRYYPSRNEGKFFIAIPETPMPLDHDGDFHVLHHDQHVTITPLMLQQTDLGEAERLSALINAK
jgi:5'-nucleotidase